MPKLPVCLVPLPLFFSVHLSTKADFTAWVAVGIAWVILAASCIVFNPIWESRSALANTFKGDVGGSLWKESKGVKYHTLAIGNLRFWRNAI